MKRITVVGIGYVGVGLAVMLARFHDVTMLDIEEKKAAQINALRSPVKDELADKYLDQAKKGLLSLHLRATTDSHTAYTDADCIIIAVPTDYDPQNSRLDCSVVEDVIGQAVRMNPNALIVIKSTVPVGFTREIKNKYTSDRILYSPEFLRESKAVYDNLFPARIIVSCDDTTREAAESFALLLRDCSEKKDTEILLTGYDEAEAVKLFSNTYLAMRVAFFNELDTFSEWNDLHTEDIIRGVCLDPRIGDYYNNPSFGYGGYCLPKDTHQLLALYNDIPESLIQAAIDSNRTRKEFIARRISELAVQKAEPGKTKPVIGIYKLAMKTDSDNYRHSAVQDVIDMINTEDFDLILYEPGLTEHSGHKDCLVINDLNRFKELSDLIIANRYHEELDDVKTKVYSRDFFRRD